MFLISRENTRRIMGKDRPEVDYRIADRCWSVLEGQSPEEGDLDLLRSTLLPPVPPMALLNSVACRALDVMSQKSAYFDTLWIELSEHADWRKRFAVAMHLDGLRRSLAIELTARLLDDRSKKVRGMAADRAHRLDARELLSPLKARLQMETDVGVKRSLDVSIDVIETPPVEREGWTFKASPKARMTFRWKNGQYRGWSSHWDGEKHVPMPIDKVKL
jgi:hypothetical protein